MKRILTTLSLSLCIMSVAFPQKSPVKYGVKAGINISNLRISGNGMSVNLSSLVGFNGGFFAELPVSEQFAIQPELAYSMLGAKLKGSFDTELGELDNVKLKTNYLTIPVLAKFKIPNSGFGIYAGPQYGILLSAKATAGSESGNNKEEYKSGDFSGVFGTEYFFSNGLGLSARYQLGFSNIAKEAEAGSSMKNNTFTFTLGYKF